MGDEIKTQKCRTCLRNSTKSFPLIKPVLACSPNTTYGQILKEYAQFEYNADYERHMPQFICFLCCRQLRNAYFFIRKAKYCNLKLVNLLTKQLDCLKEQAIDLPQTQYKATLSIKEDNTDNHVNIRNTDIKTSCESENLRIHENNLSTNKSLKEEIIPINAILEASRDCFNIEASEDKDVYDGKEETALLTKNENSQSMESLLDDIECPVCNKLIAKHDNLKNHLRIQHDVSETPASIKIFNKRKPLTPEQTFRCEKCACKFTNKYEYLKHLKGKHKSGEATNSKKNAEKQKEPKKIVKCHSCDYTANSYAALNYHNRSRHGTEDDKLKCKFCSYTSFKKCNLLVHVKNVHKELIKKLKANNSSNKDESINRHINSSSYDNCNEGNCLDNTKYTSDDDLSLAHTLTKPADLTFNKEEEQDEEEFSDEDFIRNILNIRKRPRKMLSTKALARRCEECGNIYKDYKSLCAHKRSVHISEDKFSLCPHCGKKYKRKGDLRIHIEKTHTPQKDIKTVKQSPRIPKVREKRFMCTQCSYTCTTITILNIHINRHHTGEKPYKCDICFKSFIVPYDLKVHRYLHTGEKPYKCPICSKGFRDNSHMIKHKRIHTNERPYKCNDCGKSFTQSYNLSVHKRTHLKEKKLNCSICGKFFENKSMLNIHRINENHHDEVI